jgi:hypothetical protein
VFAGLALPVMAAQILWINRVTSITLGTPLAPCGLILGLASVKCLAVDAEKAVLRWFGVRRR